jgi:hypothetical protein
MLIILAGMYPYIRSSSGVETQNLVKLRSEAHGFGKKRMSKASVV